MTAMISASAHAEKNTTAKARHAASKVAAGIVDPVFRHHRCWLQEQKTRSSQEMRADDHRQCMKIEQSKKVDRAKLPIHCRRATDFCADGQVRAHELRRWRRMMPTQDRHLL
jgi:hypothetical protein